MSDEGEIENGNFQIFSQPGEIKHMPMKNERELRKLIKKSCPNNSTESGSKREYIIYSKLFKTAVKRTVALQTVENSLTHANLI